MRKCLGKTDKLSYICHGKTDKIRPFNIRKEDKDMIKSKIDRYLADFFDANPNASSFGTFFKKYTGLLPKNYRMGA